MTSPIAKRDSQRFLVRQSAILPFCTADDENHFLIGLCHRKPKLKGYNSNSTFISSFHPPPPRERCSCQICESRQIDVFSEMRYTDDLCTRKCCKFERTSNKSLSSSAINTLCYPCNIKSPLGLESSMRYTFRCFVSQ